MNGHRIFPRALAAALLFSAACRPTPADRHALDIHGFKSVPSPQVKADIQTVPRADGDSPALKLTFTKEGDERRLLAIEAPSPGDLTGCVSFVVRYRLRIANGQAPRLALVLFEKDGGTWLKVAPVLIKCDDFTDCPFSLETLRRARFSPDTGRDLQWNRIEKIRLGLVIDGPARGAFELSKAAFSKEPYRPTKPLDIPFLDEDLWSVGKDRAAKGTVTIDKANGCMRFDFSFPGGRHMYDIPSVAVPDVELQGYGALRLTYKARIPSGIPGLLVMLRERDGSQYYADPPPPPSDDWKTITIPFSNFTLGRWTRDENDKLDIAQIGSVSIGLHGTASEREASGYIMTSQIQFIPRAAQEGAKEADRPPR